MVEPAPKPALPFGSHTVPHDVAVTDLAPCLSAQELGRLAQTGKGPQAFVKWYFANNPHLYALQGMPELAKLTKGDSYEHTKERLTICGRAKAEAKKLYGSQRGRYVWAERLGGMETGWGRRDRNRLVGLVLVSVTLLLAVAMGLNIAGRSIYQKSFTHIKTWYKRYLVVFFSPPALGIATALTFKWADRQLGIIPSHPEQRGWNELSAQELQKVGAYGLMDKEQFILLFILNRLAAHLEERRNAAVDSATDDVISQWARGDRIKTELQLGAAYEEGCYRIHSAAFVAEGKSASNRAHFSLNDMWPSYAS